ncbi:HU family DNA-binding protein [Sphingorhabdus sp. YGSMI21]|uniref:HU family DNA-binding protein n=1 Tax=Sphingorhabdus sp. YGSMI21 TaxID=2077182 RepID=UPI000C1EFBBC|nr:HU family DNA-binding protein [Sphingorhabdus sp. YGSMI21]ATW05224.1 DNA-binding protein HU [Sphingorhabdus sp. YGSMI21]
MNRQDLISAVAEASGLSKTDAAKAVDAIFDAIAGTLSRGGDVRLAGFGTFSTSRRKASTGRNPRTGEPMQLAPSTSAKFKAGKGLKEAINNRRGGDDGWIGPKFR